MVICKHMGCQKMSSNVGQCREQPNFGIKCDKYPATNCSFFGICDYGFLINLL